MRPRPFTRDEERSEQIVAEMRPIAGDGLIESQRVIVRVPPAIWRLPVATSARASNWHRRCSSARMTYHARDLLRIPGLVSFSRVVLALAFLAVASRPGAAVVVLGLALFSDAFDGWYARRTGQVTDAGAVLDAVADKVFVGVVAVALVATHRLSVPEVLLLGVRDLGELGIAVALAVQLDHDRLAGAHKAGIYGKATTFLQYATAGAALLSLGRTTMLLAIGTGAVGLMAVSAYARQESSMRVRRDRS